jgi:hypothetical protein
MRTAVARRAQAAVPSCRLVMARYGRVGDVEQGQAPHGAAFVEGAGGFPFDVGLGEDGFDDLAHLGMPDEGVAVLVDRQHRSGVGVEDRLPPFDRLITGAAAAGVPPGDEHVGGDGFPVQPGENAGFGPGAGVVAQHDAFLVPGHLPNTEHGFDVCWHASTPFDSGG